MIHEVLSLDKATIWIKLWHVPLELYSQKMLGYLAGVVGKPLYTDKATALKQQLKFAKLCVEVDARFNLPGFILVELNERNCVDIAVELVWSRPRCDHCHIFGHLE
ncbi:hypothetical protein V6N13_108299 [Hibiscus sabdariffa]